MLTSAPAFVAVVLFVSGIFPVLAARSGGKLFAVVPAVVLSYGAAVGLAVCGCWTSTAEVAAAQRALLDACVPALVFLQLVRCDLGGVRAMGRRVLVAFACATLSIMAGVTIAWVVWQPWMPPDGWRPLAALGAGWIGGAANLVAVGRAIDLSPDGVSIALAIDTICYAGWVMVLFTTVPLAPRFNQWARVQTYEIPSASRGSPSTPAPGEVLVWLSLGLAAGNAAMFIADWLPAVGSLTPTAWGILMVTIMGVAAAACPLARLPGSEPTASALLAVVVVTMGTQASLSGFASAPIFILVGITAIAMHALGMLAAARLFGLDLALCGIASLASIGGLASAPVLAAAHSPALVPIAISLALCGYLLGNAAGLGLAWILPALGSGTAP